MKAPRITLAVLIAGGKSRRMGSLGDKAVQQWNGLPFWRNQLNILALLKPARLMVVAPERPLWLPDSVVWLPDATEPAGIGPIGPIGGLLAALENAQNGLVASLALDLPAMTPEYLTHLQSVCHPNRGVIPHTAHGYEPLAAIYPAEAAGSARDWIATGRRDLQGWVEQLIQSGLLTLREVAAADLPLFRNLNTPQDLADAI